MEFKNNDGGRAAAGFKKADVGDCGVRALAIVSDLDYMAVRRLVEAYAAKERIGKRRKHHGRSTPDNGIWMPTYKKILADLGWTWVPTMHIGQGCTVHLKKEELPEGKIIVRLSKHYAAVVNGVINDTHIDDRNGTRCVYGYWTKDITLKEPVI